MSKPDANFTVESALAELHERYIAANPRSRAANDSARRSLPGGNTRTVLHYDPFPLMLARGEGAEVWDLDGHRYADFVGEFSAGLYGHSDATIQAAIAEAMGRGIVLGGPTELEAKLADAVTARFPSIHTLRFCNSGTEANIMALVTATALTGKRKVLAFYEAYHGGVLVFSGGGSPLNVPFDVVLGEYNAVETSAALIEKHRDELAAVIVEPVLGACGNIPGTREFLTMLRDETARRGILLIFDEVKSSRCGPGGIQGAFGITPDMTTLGKYLGGGLPSGAFGGREDIMSRFDPRHPKAFRHAGTFNNNVCAMAAGLAGLTQVFTAERAARLQQDCERFRTELESALAARALPLQCVGSGSLLTIHFSHAPVTRPKDIPPISRSLSRLLHMELLLAGVLVAARGDMFPMLATTSGQMQMLRDAILGFAEKYAPMLERYLGAPPPPH
ncbi:MAG: aminotransferase class III-fold pyridoxal phosphate-dependent enzyme [Variibacter sp.]|nr:aminotransferase class III-fold pyridoxal phosphate-dependent enzyme [Variibacter sp.]